MNSFLELSVDEMNAIDGGNILGVIAWSAAMSVCAISTIVCAAGTLASACAMQPEFSVPFAAGTLSSAALTAQCAQSAWNSR